MNVQTTDVLTLAAWNPFIRPVTGPLLRVWAAYLNKMYNWNSTSPEEAHAEINAARAKKWISTMLPWRTSITLAATSEAAATVRAAYIAARVARYLQSERLAGYSGALLLNAPKISGSRPEVIAGIYRATAEAVAQIAGEEGKNINDPELVRALYYLGATVRGKPARDIAALSRQHRYDVDVDREYDAAAERVKGEAKTAAERVKGEAKTAVEGAFDKLLDPLRTAAGEQYDKLKKGQSARRHRQRLRRERAKLVRNLALAGGAVALLALIAANARKVK
jgi:hypothetical protein